MPLKAKIANKIVADDNGYTIGEIIDINEIDEHTEKEGKKEVTYASQFEFLIAVDGTKKQTLLRFWTGQNINSEKFENEGDDTTDYNRLTRLLLNMGVLDAKKLADLDKEKESEIDLEALRGRKIQFKMNKSVKRKGLSVIDIKSIKPTPSIKPVELDK
jgi:hypothetical protein